MRGHDLFGIAVVLAAVLCYSTILLGANVMASDNGLACPEWPSCFGNGNYLPAFQGGVVAEWSHRVAAFFLSVSILAIALLAVAFERRRKVLLAMSLGALGLVVTEALLGGLVVDSGLATVLVVTHLAIATGLFGLLLILSLLANLHQLPRRWIEWARRASEAAPPAPAPPSAPRSATRRESPALSPNES